jgi:ferritin-like metal-binding protein YciE
MEVKNLDSLYIDGLRDLYSAEEQLVEALPKVAKAVSIDKLRTAVENHHKVTQGHVQRLQKIFSDLGEDPKGHTCVAMKGILKEGEELMRNVENGPVLDAALIGAAQKVEHYEMAGYGTSRTFAEMLGHTEHADLLQKTLNEEGETDKELTKLAEDLVNERAAKGGSGSEKTTMGSSSSR